MSSTGAFQAVLPPASAGGPGLEWLRVEPRPAGKARPAEQLAQLEQALLTLNSDSPRQLQANLAFVRECFAMLRVDKFEFERECAQLVGEHSQALAQFNAAFASGARADELAQRVLELQARCQRIAAELKLPNTPEIAMLQVGTSADQDARRLSLADRDPDSQS